MPYDTCAMSSTGLWSWWTRIASPLCTRCDPASQCFFSPCPFFTCSSCQGDVVNVFFRIRLTVKIEILWWLHQMEIFSALLAVCARNSLVTGEFPSKRPVERSFDIYLTRALNKRLSKQSRGWWLVTPSSSLWRQCDVWLSEMWRTGLAPACFPTRAIFPHAIQGTDQIWFELSFRWQTC